MEIDQLIFLDWIEEEKQLDTSLCRDLSCLFWTESPDFRRNGNGNGYGYGYGYGDGYGYGYGYGDGSYAH